MPCKNCGGRMEGDGYSVALHCESVDVTNTGVEPDANPVYCDDMFTPDMPDGLTRELEQQLPVGPTPDQFCITQPDGECISTDPRCMHQPR